MAAPRYFVTFLAALVAGILAGLPVLPMGLVVPIVVVLPLTFLFVAVVAAASALWAGNLVGGGSARGRPLPVFAVSLATSLVLVALSLLLGLLPLRAWMYAPPGYLLILCAVAVSVNATAAAWRYREEGRSLRRDALYTVAAIFLSVAVLVAVLFLTCSLGYCGA